MSNFYEVWIIHRPTRPALKGALTGMGVSESVANDYIDMVKGMNEGRMQEDIKRTPETTTKTSIEDFSMTFAAAYKG